MILLKSIQRKLALDKVLPGSKIWWISKTLLSMVCKFFDEKSAGTCENKSARFANKYAASTHIF